MVDKQRIFISGVAGFLGSHLADAFIADGYSVVGIDNLIGGYIDNIPSKCEFYQIDCNSFSDVNKYMKGANVVYHCAASPYEGLSVFSPHFVSKNIITASTGMISAAVSNKVHRFVMCSSMARYGTNEVPFTEDMVPLPQDPYAIGKFCSEMLLKNIANTHGMEWVIAVPHSIIGSRQKYDDPYRNVASIFINLMLQGRQPYIYGDGSQKRCFSFITDVISQLTLMAFAPQCNGEVINIGPDDEFITINLLAETIAKIIGFDLKPLYMPGRPQEVHLANCSADKARKLLGYEPHITLEDGLRQMIDWIKLRGTKPFQYHIDLEIINDITPKTWEKKLF
jgi:UDP-glucose 4-epimerase